MTITAELALQRLSEYAAAETRERFEQMYTMACTVYGPVAVRVYVEDDSLVVSEPFPLMTQEGHGG